MAMTTSSSISVKAQRPLPIPAHICPEWFRLSPKEVLGSLIAFYF
jgi:hypothetical protein